MNGGDPQPWWPATVIKLVRSSQVVSLGIRRYRHRPLRRHRDGKWRVRLKRPKDLPKDQTYFLHAMPRKPGTVLFPLARIPRTRCEGCRAGGAPRPRQAESRISASSGGGARGLSRRRAVRSNRRHRRPRGEELSAATGIACTPSASGGLKDQFSRAAVTCWRSTRAKPPGRRPQG